MSTTFCCYLVLSSLAVQTPSSAGPRHVGYEREKKKIENTALSIRTVFDQIFFRYGTLHCKLYNDHSENSYNRNSSNQRNMIITVKVHIFAKVSTREHNYLVLFLRRTRGNSRNQAHAKISDMQIREIFVARKKMYTFTVCADLCPKNYTTMN